MLMISLSLSHNPVFHSSERIINFLLNPVMLCNNQRVVAIAHNPVFHPRTKHMEIDIFCIYDQVLSKQLEVYHILILNQWPDILTKPLSSNCFELLRLKLNV
ncbi:hypothetical protein V8G54_035811, partial [Vigna mungo]